MRLEEYRDLYDKVSLSEEADHRILREIKEGKTPGRGNRFQMRADRIAAAAAVLVLAAGIIRIPVVASATQSLVNRFSDVIILKLDQDDDTTSVTVYSGITEYLDVKQDAPKKECKMDSLAAVSEALGIGLLQSEDAQEEKNCISYTPYVSEDGVLNGVNIKDDFYALGDIRDAKYNISEDPEESNTVSYRPGEKYQSPIKVEITARTSNEDGADEENHELDNCGRTETLTGEAAIQVKEIYEIQNLGGVQAFLSEDETDGVSTWEKREGAEIQSCTSAYFTYGGVEYRYVGAVSMETMKEFLEGLKIP